MRICSPDLAQNPRERAAHGGAILRAQHKQSVVGRPNSERLRPQSQRNDGSERLP